MTQLRPFRVREEVDCCPEEKDALKVDIAGDNEGHFVDEDRVTDEDPVDYFSEPKCPSPSVDSLPVRLSDGPPVPLRPHNPPPWTLSGFCCIYCNICM